MAPTLVPGPVDPPMVNYALKLKHRHQFIASLTAAAGFTSITAATALANLPGLAGITAFRLLKVSVYGSDTAAVTGSGTTNPLGNYIAVQAPGDSSFLDANTQTFEDYGVTGAARPSIHYIPAFVQRERWYSTSASDVLLKIANGYGTSQLSSSVIVQLSLELQSATESPALLRSLQGP